MQSFAALVALVVLAGVQHAAAVCPSGQMAVGYMISSSLQGTHEVAYYNGFLMANNCGIISVNGETEDPNQMCYGGYNGGAAVYCSGADNPTQAVDTKGNSWRCSRTSDTSCNKYLGYGSANVVACCTRE